MIKKMKRNKGQTMMEYLILVALLAVASIPVVKILGDVFRNQVVESADAVVGGGVHRDEGKAIVRQGTNKVRRSMDNFSNQ